LINLSFSGNPAHRLQQIAINFGSYPYLALTGDNHCKGGTVFRQTCWNIGNNLSSSDTKYDSMADAVFMYAVTAGIFVFLTASCSDQGPRDIAADSMQVWKVVTRRQKHPSTFLIFCSSFRPYLRFPSNLLRECYCDFSPSAPF